MNEPQDTRGEPLSPEALRMLDYLRTRAAEMGTAGIRERIRAAAQELEKAVKARDNLVKTLTPSQIEAGQKLVREWIATHPQAAQ